MNYFPAREKQKFIKMFTTAAYKLNNVSNNSAPPAAAVVYRNEIHLLGGAGNETENIYHAKIDVKTGTVADVGTLPFKFDIGSAVVLNDEIHLLGSNKEPNKHYKWDGETWTQVSTIPFSVYYTVAVALDGEIHLISGANNSVAHYKWNGETWTQVGTVPLTYSTRKAAVVVDGEIHYLVSLTVAGNDNYHYKWNGETWVNLGKLPCDIRGYKNAVSFDDMIFMHDADNSMWYYTWTESANKWNNYKNANDVTSEDSPCNVYFGGWHDIGGGSNPVTHTVAAVPVYIPID